MATPELCQRLRESPHAYFRFLGQAWMRQVCAAFSEEIALLPAVRLHGDAHVEQYAVTGSARGLDDFDDSAQGPAAIDLVRFLGSVELAAFQRGWLDSRTAIADALFSGYRRGLQDPDYLPPEPAVVRRLRVRGSKSRPEFLAWADSLMRPLLNAERAQFDASWRKLERHARQPRSPIPATYLRIKKLGWISLGIGSSLNRKVLIRVEGPSPAPDDDVVMEGKEVSTLRGVPCLTIPESRELLRVLEGVTQIGRVRHDIVVLMPLFPPGRPEARGWWVKTWEASYTELGIADLASAEELAEVAHDVGVQLGSANLRQSGEPAQGGRLAELESVTRLEPRIRQVATELSAATLQAWEEFRRR